MEIFMIQTAAEELVFFLLRHKWLDREKRDIYEYAMEVILLNGGILIINLILGILFGKLTGYLAFLLLFVPLRRYLGGFHFKSSGVCMICSILFFVVSVFTCDLLYQNFGELEFPIVLLIDALALLGKPLPGKVKGTEKRANVILVAEMAVIVVCWVLQPPIFAACLLMNASAVSFYFIQKGILYGRLLEQRAAAE